LQEHDPVILVHLRELNSLIGLVMLSRIIESQLLEQFFKGKIIHLFGARQVGKSTLLRQLSSKIDIPILHLNGDNIEVQQQFEVASQVKLGEIVKSHEVIFLDEAQRIKDIGISLKILIDNFPDKQILATGSSAFELANEIVEPLTGRKFDFMLFPFSYQELVQHHGQFEESRYFEQRIIYGSYPEVVAGNDDKKEVLLRLADAFLYKDIFILENIKKPMVVQKLLQALALQVGNEVSLTEVGRLIQADYKTVERYIDLLEQAYIIFRLPSLSRNARNEIMKSRKIYFFDNGLRNAIIRNFNPLNARNDVVALWENYCISERYKYTSYHRMWMNRFFWRTHAQQEIDYIEEYDGVLHAYEFKWNPRKKSKLPKAFSDNYPGHEYKVITPDNYLEFVS
jgi:predicted AAA+ superfamily ATPase